MHKKEAAEHVDSKTPSRKAPKPQQHHEPIMPQPVVVPQTNVTKVVEKVVDPEITKKVQFQIEQMNQKHLDEMQKMMTVIKSQSNIKEGEIKKVVEEKNKQIELLKKTEKEKERMNNELMIRFEAERE